MLWLQGGVWFFESDSAWRPLAIDVIEAVLDLGARVSEVQERWDVTTSDEYDTAWGKTRRVRSRENVSRGLGTFVGDRVNAVSLLQYGVDEQSFRGLDAGVSTASGPVGPRGKVLIPSWLWFKLPVDLSPIEVDRDLLGPVWARLRALIAATSACFSFVAHDRPWGDLPLSSAAHAFPPRFAVEVGGYYWLTVVSQGHIDVLGGLDVVRRSAPVAEVDVISDVKGAQSCALWLGDQASRISDDDYRALRDFLRPVLPAELSVQALEDIWQPVDDPEMGPPLRVFPFAFDE